MKQIIENPNPDALRISILNDEMILSMSIHQLSALRFFFKAFARFMKDPDLSSSVFVIEIDCNEVSEIMSATLIMETEKLYKISFVLTANKNGEDPDIN